MIRPLMLAVLLAAPDPDAVRGADADSAAPVVELERLAPPPIYWLKRYALPRYGAHWRLELLVKDFGPARDKALKILEASGGEPAIPVENSASSDEHGFQQLSFRLSRAGAERALKKLRRLGALRALRQSPDFHIETPPEAALKLAQLKAERKAGGEILARLSSIAATADELIAHLEEVASAADAARDRILFNIIIESPAQ